MDVLRKKTVDDVIGQNDEPRGESPGHGNLRRHLSARDSLAVETRLRLVVWSLVGFVVHVAYDYRHSKLHRPLTREDRS